MAGQAIVDRELTLDEFDFELPDELIAQQPLPERGASRLLHVTAGGLARSRLCGHRAAARSGMTCSCSTTPASSRHACSATRPAAAGSRRWSSAYWSRISRWRWFGPATGPRRALPFCLATTCGRPSKGAARTSSCCASNRDVLAVLEQHGHVPLPPYIAHADTAVDAERYQTVYAARPGAVAAPTAGLHFTTPLLDRLRARGVQTARVTLHVGAGTFQPVRVQRLADHRMHSEWYDVPLATAERRQRSERRTAGVSWPWAPRACARSNRPPWR